MPSPFSPIVIIGAGVISLSTAFTLLTRQPHRSIIILASELPSDPPSSYTADYASMWAGAHYRPIHPCTATTSEQRKQLEDEMALAMRTRDRMVELAREVGENICGVGERMGVEFVEDTSAGDGRWKELSGLKDGDVYAGDGDRFRVLEKGEMGGRGTHEVNGWGCEYQTYCVNVGLYCRWLMARLQDMGVRFVKRTVENFETAADFVENLTGGKHVEVIVDCSGRGLLPDAKCEIIRGQTVLVSNEFDRTMTRQGKDGTWSFLIPRPGGGGTIVGGTKEVDDWTTAASANSREQVLRSAVKWFPEFVDRVEALNILGDNVGRRPWREGGIRIENMIKGKRTLVSGYGAGGRGYELSWGAAERIAGLVDDATAVRPSL